MDPDGCAATGMTALGRLDRPPKREERERLAHPERPEDGHSTGVRGSGKPGEGGVEGGKTDGAEMRERPLPHAEGVSRVQQAVEQIVRTRQVRHTVSHDKADRHRWLERPRQHHVGAGGQAGEQLGVAEHAAERQSVEHHHARVGETEGTGDVGAVGDRPVLGVQHQLRS